MIILIFVSLCGVPSSDADEVSETSVEFCSQSLFPPISPQDMILMENPEVEYAEEALASGNCVKAIKNYDLAIAQHPKSPLLHYRRGYCYAVLENYSEALKNYRLVIGLDSNFTLAYSDRAYIYMDLGDYKNAISEFTYLINQGICNSYSLKSRGIAFYRMNELDNAQNDLEFALKLLESEQQSMVSLLPSELHSPGKLEISKLLLEISRLKGVASGD